MKKALLYISILFLHFSINAQNSLENSSWNIGPDSIHFQTDSFQLTSFGSLLVKGTYTDTVNILRLADYSGPQTCDSSLVGSYEMLFSDRKDTLSLSVISDDCMSRSIDLDGAVLTRKDLYISVNLQSEKAHVSFYPNPFKDVIFFKSEISYPLSVQLINEKGQVVLNQYIDSKSSRIETHDFPNGIYVLIIENQGIIRRELLIKEIRK